MIDSSGVYEKIESLSLKTYGPRRSPVAKEYMTKDEVIAMSPLGSTQPTNISKKFARHRESLPPVLKKALNYLHPARNDDEKPPVSVYDSMVRKMSNYSLLKKTEKSPGQSPELVLPSNKGKNYEHQPNLMKKMSGLFDFPTAQKESRVAILSKRRSKSVLKLPLLNKNETNDRFTSVDYINCVNYTGEAESEYLKTFAAQKEYRKLYELMLIDTGLYTELRIRGQNKNKIHYRRMPV